MDPVKLFYLPPSHYNEKARKILEYKDIPFETVRVPYMAHHELIRETGQDYTPAIKTAAGETITWDRIPDWAEEQVPGTTLYPDGSRGVCRVIDHWAHQVVEGVTWPYVAPLAPDVLDDEEERWRFVEFQERKWGDLDSLMKRRDELRGPVNEVCELAQTMLGETSYLLGDKPSLADFAVFGGLHPIYFVGEQVPEQFGALREWHARVAKL